VLLLHLPHQNANAFLRIADVQTVIVTTMWIHRIISLQFATPGTQHF
jgi:hypothetical protein